jgi:uncharacterized membrane protein
MWKEWDEKNGTRRSGTMVHCAVGIWVVLTIVSYLIVVLTIAFLILVSVIVSLLIVVVSLILDSCVPYP